MNTLFKTSEQDHPERDQPPVVRMSSPPKMTALSPTANRTVLNTPGPSREPAEKSLLEIDDHLVSLLTPTSFEAEQYLQLHYLIENLHKTDKLTVVAVSSATPGDGKTITSINLAATLARSPEARVLLVETDIRRPSVAGYLGLGNSIGPGLVGLIQNPVLSLEKVVRRYSRFNFSVLPAGRPPTMPYELLKSPRLEQLLAEARQRYDRVVLDMPPAIPIPDCRILAKLADGMFLVVAAHKTPRKLLEETLNAMDHAKVLGIVFNNDNRPLGGYYYKYYSSYYSPSANSHQAGMWSRIVKKIFGPSQR